MSMQIGNPAGARFSPVIDRPGHGQERRASIRELSSALQNSDLGAARHAYVEVVRYARAGANVEAGSPFAQLGKALVTGDMPAAQAAFGAMVQAWEQERGGNTPPVASASPAATNPLNGGEGGTISVTV